MSKIPKSTYNDPVLLCCSERSGSNLLRALLGAHPDIYAPNTMALGHLCAEYERNPPHPERWRLLVTEVARRINASSFYTGTRVTENELMEHVTGDDAMGLYLYAYHKGMRENDATQLVIKEHQIWRLMPFFKKSFPHVKVLAQVRDPRDYAVSCKKLGRLYASYYGSLPRAAKIWAEEQSAFLVLKESTGPGVIRMHRYEDLVDDPVTTLRRICSFINLEWEESMLNFHVQQARLANSNEFYLHNMWANLDKPINQTSVGQWKGGGLGPLESRAVVRLTSSLIEEFGYTAHDVPSNMWQLLATNAYRLCAAARYWCVTGWIWLLWSLKGHDPRVPHDVIIGKAIRGHLPYERFRDRIGYRL